MAGLAASLAVSVTVLAAPTAPVAAWNAASDDTLSSVVAQWSEIGGFSDVQVAPGLGNLQIGGVSVKAQDLCSAVSRLVASLRYSADAPRVAECDSTAGRLRIVSGNPVVATLAR